MPLDDFALPEIARQGLLAGGLGFLGRMVALAARPDRPGGWALAITLAWEIPLAWGLGILGMGAADYLRLTGFPAYAVVIAVAYAGPRSIEALIARAVAARPAPK